jgi:hypothetical protein
MTGELGTEVQARDFKFLKRGPQIPAEEIQQQNRVALTEELLCCDHSSRICHLYLQLNVDKAVPSSDVYEGLSAKISALPSPRL